MTSVTHRDRPSPASIPDFDIAGVVRTPFGLMRVAVEDNPRCCGCGEPATVVFTTSRRKEISLCSKHWEARAEQTARQEAAIRRIWNAPVPPLPEPVGWPVVFEGYLLLEDLQPDAADAELDNAGDWMDFEELSRPVVDVPTEGLL